MKGKGLFLYFLSFVLTSAGLAQDGYELTVSVKNIKNQKGKVRICLTNKKADFLNDCYRSRDVAAGGKTVTANFKNIPAGEYAVAAYHDEDENGELNKNGLFGIPSEDYGFSNNPHAFFGPPNYEKCTFKVAADTMIVIGL
ncbi:MAG: DUF2141 domain-containing protein [Saprospiraceae bacterium]|nr:MAG: DUF2141 domain-containing protein [Saprospiraceae bacterium]